MKNPPAPAEKYSRRSFAKEIVTMLAAAPLINSQAFGTTRRGSVLVSSRLAPSPSNLTLNHMPPLFFRGGSLEIDSERELKRRPNNNDDRRYKYIQNPNLCPAYGVIRGVTITNERGKQLYSELCRDPNDPDPLPYPPECPPSSPGIWEVRLWLQKVVDREDDRLEYESEVKARHLVVVRNDEGTSSFKIEINEDLNESDVRRRRRKHKKYKLDRVDGFGGDRVRIGQVSVSGPTGTKTFPEEIGPNSIANEGFQVFIFFTHAPVTVNCPLDAIRPISRDGKHKSIWEKLFGR